MLLFHGCSPQYLLAVAQENEGDFLAPLGFKHPRLQVSMGLASCWLVRARGRPAAR